METFNSKHPWRPKPLWSPYQCILLGIILLKRNNFIEYYFRTIYNFVPYNFISAHFRFNVLYLQFKHKQSTLSFCNTSYAYHIIDSLWLTCLTVFLTIPHIFNLLITKIRYWENELFPWNLLPSSRGNLKYTFLLCFRNPDKKESIKAHIHTCKQQIRIKGCHRTLNKPV